MAQATPKTEDIVFICNDGNIEPFIERLPIGPNRQLYEHAIEQKTGKTPTWSKPILVGDSWQLRYLVD